MSDAPSASASGIIITKISDHLPCFPCIDVLNTKISEPKYVKVNTNSPDAIQSFKYAVKQALEHYVHFERDLLTDPNTSYEKLEVI